MDNVANKYPYIHVDFPILSVSRRIPLNQLLAKYAILKSGFLCQKEYFYGNADDKTVLQEIQPTVVIPSFKLFISDFFTPDRVYVNKTCTLYNVSPRLEACVRLIQTLNILLVEPHVFTFQLSLLSSTVCSQQKAGMSRKRNKIHKVHRSYMTQCRLSALHKLGSMQKA